mgnify:CR=1 FL=1
MTLTDQRLARLERKTRCINCNTQFFANLAAFPTVGKDNVLYVDESNSNIYIWDGDSYETANRNTSNIEVAGFNSNWDFTDGNIRTITMTADQTITVTNSNSMDIGILIVTQDNTGGWTLTLDGILPDDFEILENSNAVTILSFINQNGFIKWQMVSKYGAALSPTEEDVVFNLLDGGVTSLSNVYTASLVAQKLSRNTKKMVGDGYTQMSLGANIDASVLGFDTNSSLEIWTDSTSCNYQVVVFVASGVLYTAYTGVLATTQVSHGSTAGIQIVRITRTGTTFKLQKSLDGTTFTDVYTYTGSYSGDMYIKGFISISGNKIISPKSFGATV